MKSLSKINFFSLLLLMSLFGLFRQSCAATKTPNLTYEERIVIKFLEEKKSFLSKISSEDCKHLLQIMRCHELVLEHFVAESLARKAAMHIDSIDFDDSQVEFLKQEQKSFDLLSSETKSFFDSMQDLIRDNGSGFDFRSVNLMFQMRSDFLKVTLEYIQQLIASERFFSSSLLNDESLKKYIDLIKIKNLISGDVSIGGIIISVHMILERVLKSLSAGVIYLDYTSVMDVTASCLFEIVKDCSRLEKKLLESEKYELEAREKIILGIVKNALTPLIKSAKNFNEMYNLFKKNYSEIQEDITDFYHDMGLFKTCYAIIYSELYKKISDTERRFDGVQGLLLNVELPNNIFLFHQKKDNLIFCKNAFQILSFFKTIRDQYFNLIEEGDGFSYQIIRADKCFENLEKFKQSCLGFFPFDSSLKCIFFLNWIRPSTLVFDYQEFYFPKISMTYLVDFYLSWFEKRVKFLESRSSCTHFDSHVDDWIPEILKKQAKQAAQQKITKRSKKKTQALAARKEIEHAHVPETASQPAPSVSDLMQESAESVQQIGLDDHECFETSGINAAASAQVFCGKSSPRTKFTDITKEFWSFFNDENRPRAEKQGIFATWVLSWNLFNDEGMTLVVYPVHSNSIDFTNFSFKSCQIRNEGKSDQGDKFHTFPNVIDKYLNFGYLIDFDDSKAFETFERTFPRLDRQIRPGRECFAVVIEAKITSKHHFRSYLNEADIVSTKRNKRSGCEHNGLLVWIFDKKTKKCVHKCFHEFV